MRILVFQHVDVEHPGVFRDFWRDAGIPYDAVELDAGEPIPPLDRYDLLVVMGGPMDVWQVDEHPWFVPEIAAIREWVVGLRRPYLGVCLGHQLLAEALGGSVGPAAVSEVGIIPVRLTEAGRVDPLFAGEDETLATLQWHGAEVTELPDEAVVLAANDACAVQAMRWGPHAYGVQFHVEITESTIVDWHRIPEYAASLHAALGPDGAERLTAESRARLAEFNALAARVNTRLMTLLHSAATDTVR